ncbi:hypothetical protein [Hoyosella altamirensis]|uniref:Uncharacterized protein n=1 Tax=Hoyosella altamirensis TaxID=616997 RepID=A0A839RUP1_9ACTN|nr:hypothetical protein [Hoyosella altamirensis]MBB3040027.1 hypothetical protein [Hoyosella altamirensis]
MSFPIGLAVVIELLMSASSVIGGIVAILLAKRTAKRRLEGDDER